jgi:para-nitrobenzyl esterase
MTRVKRRTILGLSAFVMLGLIGLVAVYVVLWNPLIFAGVGETVRVEGGLVRGLMQNGISVYRGLPFAAPPIGDLRWRAPEPVIPWEGIKDASEFAPVCMQSGETVPGLGSEPMSENCLYLNIWTPANGAERALPVMVWLYGGGRHVGSGSARLYWSERLARKDVVVVTLNYRLGAFGMLAHRELSAEAPYGASGNYLLLDQIAALRWVQRNIASFGGDPGNVTIFGQSAGATSISQLLVSQIARGLFHRAIAQSGGDLRPSPVTVSLAQAERAGAAFAEKLGARSIEDLRTIPAAEIVANDFVDYFDNGTPRGAYEVNVDGYVLSGTVRALYAQGRQQNVPFLTGYNAGDDPSFHHGAGRNWARLHAEGPAEVYAYYFTKVPPYPPFRFRGIAGHGAELIYLFGFPPPIFFYAVEFPWNAARDAELTDIIASYWTNFAKRGNPNGAGLPRWPVFDADEQILEIGETLEIVEMADD